MVISQDMALTQQGEKMPHKDKEAARLCKKAYYEANKERLLPKIRENRKSKPELHAISSLVKLYKVSREFATDLYLRSMQHCEACGDKWVAGDRRFCVDHDHDTGVVRGILCHNCNTSLGKLRESTAKLLALAAYNEKHNGYKKNS